MTHTRTLHTRTLQTRLTRAEDARRDALAAWHDRCCQKLGLSQTATDDRINAEFARRLADTIHCYERTHGLLPDMPPATLQDDLPAMDEPTLLARTKATLIQDGYLPRNISGDTP